MPFAPADYSDPVTIGYLIERKLKLGVHCHKCANYVRFSARYGCAENAGVSLH